MKRRIAGCSDVTTLRNEILACSNPSSFSDFRDLRDESPDVAAAAEQLAQTRLDDQTAAARKQASDLSNVTEQANRKKCAFCAAIKADFKRCACKTVSYCNAECQRAHWRVHKADCPARKSKA